MSGQMRVGERVRLNSARRFGTVTSTGAFAKHGTVSVAWDGGAGPCEEYPEDLRPEQQPEARP